MQWSRYGGVYPTYLSMTPSCTIQIDSNKDGLVSLEEFLKFTGQPGFDSKEEWHPIVDEDAPFSDKEFQDYEADYDEDYDYQYDQDGNIIGIVPR